MAEAAFDISQHKSKTLDDLAEADFDCVITVCDSASTRCPVFPGPTTVLHRGFDDPPALAQSAGSEEEAMQHYRRVRDEIRDYVESLPEIIGTRGGTQG